MTTAIIISGAMRSFAKCLPNLDWMVFRHFPTAKFYVATHDDEDAPTTELLIKKYGGDSVRVAIMKQPEMVIPSGCPDKWTKGQPYMHEPYAISVHPSQVMGQLWMLREGWRVYQDANEPADLIIRIRPDLWFHSFVIPHGLNACKFGPDPKVSFTPWFGRFGGCNDRFALLGTKAAEAYFTTYDNIPAMLKEGCPLHPESLVNYAMQRVGISICDDMKAEFGTMRKNGEFRSPEILPVDLAHFRG